MRAPLLAAVAIACFAYAQVAVAAHEAAYGTDIHFHDGELCAISLHGDRHDQLDVPQAAVLAVSFEAVFVFRPANAAVRSAAIGCAPRARAPPHHSSTA